LSIYSIIDLDGQPSKGAASITGIDRWIADF
jgi:hypothetical protein